MSTGRIFSRPAQKVDLFNSFIDWIYPPQCRVCGKESGFSPFLCKSCYSALQVFDKTPDSIVYHKDHPADMVIAFYLFDEQLQKLIHEIKYKDASYIATFLGEKAGEYYQESKISDCVAIIPVPLHSVRKRERTYNQSACIASGLSNIWKIPVLKKTVKRCRNTGTQTKLNKDQRRENIKNAFKIRKNSDLPESVCIVDDVFTTGATTMELARTLKKAGVEKIHIFCLATPLHEKGVTSKE